MARVLKDNKLLVVNDDQVDSYLIQGYSEIDSEGNELRKATGGKVVPLAEHYAVVKELEELKKSPAVTGNESEEITDMKADIKVLEQENERLDKLVKQFKAQQQARQQSIKN